MKVKIVIATAILLLTVLFPGCIQVGEEGANLEEVTATVYINFGNGTVWKFENITTRNATVYGLLLEAAKQGNFSVDATYYGEMNSVFINSIAGVENQEGKYWQYWINGKYGNVGADKQKVNNSDVIEWKYTESQFW